MSIFAVLCAATSVALGAVYMLAASAPRHYLVINAAALVAGVVLASVVRRLARTFTRSGAVAVATGVLLVATAFIGVQIDGASRWLSVAGIALQPSLILLPAAMAVFARSRDWLSSIGLIIAAIGLALQPDRAMAGTLVAGVGVLWLRHREPPVIVAFAAALFGFAAAMVSADSVAPVPFVEQVVQSAFAFNVLAGIAVVAGLVTMLAPAVSGRGSPVERDVAAVSGATWLAVTAFSIVGNYPTPLVGYGSSAILGYCVSAVALTRQLDPTRPAGLPIRSYASTAAEQRCR